MTLPIQASRAGGDTSPASNGPEQAPSSRDDRSFLRALSSAIHGPANRARERAPLREGREPQPTTADSVSVVTPNCGVAVHAACAATDALTALATAVAGEATTPADAAGPHHAAPPGNAATPRDAATPGDAAPPRGVATTGDAATPRDVATPGDVNAAREEDALAESELAPPVPFVPHALEQVMAPLPPMVIVAADPAVPVSATVETADETPRAPLALASSAPRAAKDLNARARALAAELARDPLAVRREVEGLRPEMRERLERVIERMEQEYGYTVDVVETVRSQPRQDALFAQGRSAPGPVVTWTRHSRHVDGRAADVVIDGGYTNGAGFERLARVAREEGLRTLWPRDPGHIELVDGIETPGAPARSHEDAGEVRILPARPLDDVPRGPRALPHQARSAVDPTSGRLAPPPISNDRMRALPVPGEPQALPFPVPSPSAAPSAGPAVPTDRVARAPSTVGDAPTLPLTRGRGSPNTAVPIATRTTPSLAPDTGVAAGDSGIARIATVAPVAELATLARMAEVARVAEVARPGESAPTAPTVPLTAGVTLAANAAVGTKPGGADDRHASHHGDRRERAAARGPLDAAAGPHGEKVARAGGALELSPDLAMLAAGERGESPPAMRGDAATVGGLARSDATERIARVLRLQDAEGERPLSSVLLRLDHPDGGEDRIRIDLRGRSIGATLDLADARSAEQLRAHVPELQHALQQQGLEGEALIVRSASRNQEGVSVSASAIAAERDLARAASATASDGGGSTARDSRNPPRGAFDRSSDRDGMDQQRSRQRRDGKGDTR